MSNYNQEETSYPSLEIMKGVLGSTKYQHWYQINRNNCKDYWNPYEELEMVARKEIEKWRKNKK